MEKQDWINKCAERLEERLKHDHDLAIDCANALLDNLGGDLTESPIDAADDEYDACLADEDTSLF